MGPSRRVRTGVQEVLAEEARARARSERDVRRISTASAPSGGETRAALRRLTVVLLGAGLGALGGAAWGDRATGVALGVAAGFTLPTLLPHPMWPGSRSAAPDLTGST